MALQIRTAPGCGPTSRILAGLIRAEGVEVNGISPNIVSWGVRVAPRDGQHSLNGSAGRYDKLRQQLRLREAGVACLDCFERVPGQQEVYPLIARRLHHVAGRDIRVCLQPEDAEHARRLGADFFTKFIPRQTEFRVWVYRRRHLGTYEKILTRPDRYTRFGCNYQNGWAFRLLREQDVPRDSVELASRAIDALGLDFGVADILVPKTGNPVVLECNCAPGVEGPDRQVIRSLAHKIARWHNSGFLRRNGDHAE